MTAPSDEDLYVAYLGGDGNALRILMERYGDTLTLYINGYIHDIHEAEESVSTCSRFLKSRLTLFLG